MSSQVGRFLNQRFNFFVTQVMPRAVGDRKVLSPEVMRHYRQAQPDPRVPPGLPPPFLATLIGASDWLESIWSARKSFTDKPCLVLWGHKDIAFRPQELSIWESELTNYVTRNFPQCGHFLAEESPETVSQSIAQFMLGNPKDCAGNGRKHG